MRKWPWPKYWLWLGQNIDFEKGKTWPKSWLHSIYIYIYIWLWGRLPPQKMPFFSFFPQFYSKKWPKRDVANLPRLCFLPVNRNNPKLAWDCSPKPFFSKKVIGTAVSGYIYIYATGLVCRRKFLAFFDILVSIRDKIKVNWPMTLTPQKGHDSRSSLQELRSKLPVCFDIVPFTPQKGHDSRFSLQELRNPSQFLCSGPYFQGVWGGHSWFWLTLSGSFWGSV